jgi:steroid delta-isomerase-like uncharacterized protein
MSVEQNKATVLRFYEEVWNKGDLDVAGEIFADDYIRHDLRQGMPSGGPEGQKTGNGLFRSAFPDTRLTVDFIVAEGDMVVARWTIEGTHEGAWAGIAPTGKRVSFAGVNIYRFAGNKVAELWNHRDDLGLAEQIGAPVYAGFPEQR